MLCAILVLQFGIALSSALATSSFTVSVCSAPGRTKNEAVHLHTFKLVVMEAKATGQTSIKPTCVVRPKRTLNSLVVLRVVGGA